MNAAIAKNLIGQRVNFSGDIANSPRSGIVTDIVETRWNLDAVILWDEDNAIGWDSDGEAAEAYEPCTRIAANMIEEKKSPSARFYLA